MDSIAAIPRHPLRPNVTTESQALELAPRIGNLRYVSPRARKDCD